MSSYSTHVASGHLVVVNLSDTQSIAIKILNGAAIVKMGHQGAICITTGIYC